MVGGEFNLCLKGDSISKKFICQIWFCLFALIPTVTVYSQEVYEVWISRYNGPGNNSDHPYEMVLDKSGNICVTGYSYGGSTNLDFLTVKYSPTGDTLWVRRYD